MSKKVKKMDEKRREKMAGILYTNISGWITDEYEEDGRCPYILYISHGIKDRDQRHGTEEYINGFVFLLILRYTGHNTSDHSNVHMITFDQIEHIRARAAVDSIVVPDDELNEDDMLWYYYDVMPKVRESVQAFDNRMNGITTDA